MKKSKNPRAKRGMLKEALADLSNEISNINKNKKMLNDQIKNADKSLESFRKFETKLQQKIANLLEREALLKERKKKISLDEERLTDKLSKIQRIKSELDEI